MIEIKCKTTKWNFVIKLVSILIRPYWNLTCENLFQTAREKDIEELKEVPNKTLVKLFLKVNHFSFFNIFARKISKIRWSEIIWTNYIGFFEKFANKVFFRQQNQENSPGFVQKFSKIKTVKFLIFSLQTFKK